MSVQARACDATNSGGRTPGSKLPASPPPLPHPNGGGTRAVYLSTRPKKPTRHAMNRTIWNETSIITRHGDASTSAAHWSRRDSAVCRRRARGHDCCSGIEGASCQAVDTDAPLNFHSRLELPKACSYPCHAQKADTT